MSSAEQEIYTPDPVELWDRAEIVQWMSCMEWPDNLMDSIMRDDKPEIIVVRNLVWRHGPNRALELLLSLADLDN